MNRLLLIISTAVLLVSCQNKTDKKEASDDQIPLSSEKIVKSKINFNSNPEAEEYKTVITQKYNELDVNFANYYIITTWGCGSGCVNGAMVDIRDGFIYNMPEDKEWGGMGTYIESDKESNVLKAVAVAQSPDEVEENRKYWEWDEQLKKFKFVKKESEIVKQ